MRKQKRKKSAGCLLFFIFIVFISVYLLSKNGLPFRKTNGVNGGQEEVLIGTEKKTSTDQDKVVQEQNGKENSQNTHEENEKDNEPILKTNVRANWIRNLNIASKFNPNAALILQKQDQVAEPLLRLAGNNFAAINFVAKTLDHSVKADYSYPSNLNGGQIPYFIQWDQRWGYENYAGGIIGYTGCGPTSAAMVLSGLLKDDSITPATVAKLSQEKGYANAEGTSWNLYPYLAQLYRLHMKQISVDYNTIKEYSQKKCPIIVSVGPGDFTTVGHVMVIVDIDRNGRLVINDPNSRENSEKHWDFNEIKDQFKTMWVFSKDEI